MEFVPVDGRGLHFQKAPSFARGAPHLEALGSEMDVVPRRTTLRECTVLRSNASFPHLKRETPVLVELELPEEAAAVAQKLVDCLAVEVPGARGLLRKGAEGALCLLVTAPSFYYNRWSRQEARLGIWGPAALDVGDTVTVVVDGLVRRGAATVALRETL